MLGKIWFESLTDKSKLDAQPALFIRRIPDKATHTLPLIDSGIGITKSDSVGTIARSGTKNFMEALVAGANVAMILMDAADRSAARGHFQIEYDRR